MATQTRLNLEISPTLNSWLLDSPAKLSLLLDIVQDLTKQEALYFLTSHGLLRKKDQNIYYLKTSKDCFLTTTDELLKPSSPRLMSWTMTRKLWSLTANFSNPVKGHESLSTHHTGTPLLTMGKGITKLHRYTLTSGRGHELRTYHAKKLGELPAELYEHLQGYPIGWTAGKPSTVRKRLMGNSVQPKVVKAILAEIFK